MSVQRFSRLPNRRLTAVFILGTVLCLALLGGGLAAVSIGPQLAAQSLDLLRGVIGDKWVAQLETEALNVQDTAQQWAFEAGLLQPAAPWASTRPATNTGAPDASLSMLKLPAGSKPLAAHSLSPTTIPAWAPSPLPPLGALSGEGQWSPYLSNADGQVVAYRTFLQPDTRRPYSVAAVVAFDLRTTRLHFVLGTVEPASSVPAVRTGAILPTDMQPNVLLAAFNGGFKARHGHYGAMAYGVVALPPITGLGTVAMYADGRVQIGVWGTEITDSSDLVSWRQNGQLLIHHGRINPNIADVTKDWGLTVNGTAVTWRSALGISPDGGTLYYVAGPSLDVSTLAKAIAATGAAEALQLDINDYWVHFTAFRSDGAALAAEPLLNAMSQQPDRFLKSYSRDFFYVTADNGKTQHE